MKIFITGCARSGTTLLRRLFYSFDNVEIIDHELSLPEFVDKKSDKILVGKRTKHSILSHDYKEPEIFEKAALELLKHTKVINLLRNGYDVIESGEDATPQRWLDSIDAYLRLKEYIDLNIFYEDLVTNPDLVQDQIIEKFNLKKLHDFNEYPAFVPEKGLEEAKRYTPKPTNTSRINKQYNWRKVVPINLQGKFKEVCDLYRSLHG
jgi:hypothetical protein